MSLGVASGGIMKLGVAPLAALCIIGMIAILCVAGPFLNPNRIDALDWNFVAQAPSLTHAHWFGTDRLGRDLFVRTLVGARISLSIGLIATALSLVIGVAFGAVAGFFGGLTDQIMMRLVEILSGLPLIFFVILLTVLFGHSIWLLFAAIGAVGWMTMARIVRGQTQSIRHKEYIQAAVAGGAGYSRIIFRHIVPNLLATVVVYASLTMPQIILFESFLSFLGLGIQEPNTSLGGLIAEGAGEMESALWMLLIPGGMLTLMLLSFNVLGEGLREFVESDGA